MVMGVSSLIFVRVDTPAVLSRCGLSSSSSDLKCDAHAVYVARGL